jgi:hypothetical protein
MWQQPPSEFGPGNANLEVILTKYADDRLQLILDLETAEARRWRCKTAVGHNPDLA